MRLVDKFYMDGGMRLAVRGRDKIKRVIPNRKLYDMLTKQPKQKQRQEGNITFQVLLSLRPDKNK